MRYQYLTDYVMDGSKFFNLVKHFEVTPYEQGMREMVRHFKQSV